MIDAVDNPRPTSNVVGAIVQHLRRYPFDIRHVRKLFHRFQASTTEVETALNQFALMQEDDDVQRWLWSMSQQKTPADHIFLHLLRYPADIIDIQRLMRQYRASETDIQQAFAQIDECVVGEEGIVVYENVDKK